METAQVENPLLEPIRGPVPLARTAQDELHAQIRAVAGNPVVRALLDALDGGLLVLNAQRQIVAANLRGLVSGHLTVAELVLGLRPGEALGCTHASERPGGCGASLACRTCGALKA